MIQCLAAEQHGDQLLLDQAKALRGELLNLNIIADEGKKATLFQAWDINWHAGSMEDGKHLKQMKSHQQQLMFCKNIFAFEDAKNPTFKSSAIT